MPRGSKPERLTPRGQRHNQSQLNQLHLLTCPATVHDELQLGERRQAGREAGREGGREESGDGEGRSAHSSLGCN